MAPTCHRFACISIYFSFSLRPNPGTRKVKSFNLFIFFLFLMMGNTIKGTECCDNREKFNPKVKQMEGKPLKFSFFVSSVAAFAFATWWALSKAKWLPFSWKGCCQKYVKDCGLDVCIWLNEIPAAIRLLDNILLRKQWKWRRKVFKNVRDEIMKWLRHHPPTIYPKLNHRLKSFSRNLITIESLFNPDQIHLPR